MVIKRKKKSFSPFSRALPSIPSSSAAWQKVLGHAPKFYVLLATLEVPSEALLHPQKLKIVGDPIIKRHVLNKRKRTRMKRKRTECINKAKRIPKYPLCYIHACVRVP